MRHCRLLVLTELFDIVLTGFVSIVLQQNCHCLIEFQFVGSAYEKQNLKFLDEQVQAVFDAARLVHDDAATRVVSWHPHCRKAY